MQVAANTTATSSFESPKMPAPETFKQAINAADLAATSALAYSTYMLDKREFSIAKPEAIKSALEAAELLVMAKKLATDTSLPYPQYLPDATRRLEKGINALVATQTSESSEHLEAIAALYLVQGGIRNMIRYDKS